jgi:NodT family efflux transporter outer membrane factor (OMF) lipoprotein
MHADLAVDYFEARTLDAEERLLNDTVRQYQQALELNQKLFDEGLTSILSVQQAQAQLETTRAAAIDVGVLRAQYEHAVAVLVGKPPETFSLPPLPLTTAPAPIPGGVPSELLERRPDIASAERMAAAANAQIGVAKSAYYPLINLTAAAGFESGSITTLLQGPGVLWSFGPSAVATIFDFGRRRAVSDQAKAAYNQAVANYRQTVLTGFQQVEDNLAALRVLAQEAEVQRGAVTAAQAALDTSMTLFTGGLTSYLTVTTAQTTLLTDQVTSINILGRRMAGAVLLVQALGGGWDASTLKNY